VRRSLQSSFSSQFPAAFYHAYSFLAFVGRRKMKKTRPDDANLGFSVYFKERGGGVAAISLIFHYISGKGSIWQCDQGQIYGWLILWLLRRKANVWLVRKF
jgi:hypothetical protein